MTNLQMYSPFSQSIFRPYWDTNEYLPGLTLSEGLDVYEKENRVCVDASVPGVPAENVDVTYEDGVLRITARHEEKEDEKKKKKTVYRQERVISFDYTTTLPRPIDPKTIEATTEDGVVSVQAEVAKEAQPKKVQVKNRDKKKTVNT